MTFEIITGDVFADITIPTIIAHGCNDRGVMGAGIALTIKDRYPYAYNIYANKYKFHGKLDLGEAILCKVGPSLYIANCITQTLVEKKRNLNYVALVNSMQKVIRYAKKHELDVRFPFIGGGLGGGDPDFLIDIYSDLFDNEYVKGTLYIYGEK